MPTTQPRAAVTKLLDAINSENFDCVSESIVTKNEEYLIKKVSTEKCLPWKFANRLTKFIDENSCSDLIASLKNGKQRIPAIVRKIPQSDQYEVLCGIRRLYACKTLKIPILVAIVDVKDKEALLIMDVENRSRVDISPYERAIDYHNWISSGIYKNHKEIQEITGIKKSWFSQLMALAELPSEVVAAFGHPKNLKQKWGYKLRSLCKDETIKTKMIGGALEIKDKNYHPRTIYSKLLRCHLENVMQNSQKNFANDGDYGLLKTTRSSTGGLNIFIKKNWRKMK